MDSSPGGRLGGGAAKELGNPPLLQWMAEHADDSGFMQQLE